MRLMPGGKRRASLRAAALLVGALATVASTAGATQRETPTVGTRVPRLPTPAAQLAYARRLKRTLVHEAPGARAARDSEDPGDRRDPPDPRDGSGRERAVEAYRAVRVHHPRARAAGAEAAFRAGELLRAAGEPARALAEFEVAGELGENTAFRARARLEIGHLHRRARRAQPALDAYLRVASDPTAARTHRDEAWLWAGLLWREAERLDDARRAWRRVAEHGVDPLDRIRAFDRLGLLWIDGGDLEAAAGVLDECARALGGQASEETPQGARIRRGLGRMRVAAELARRIEQRKALKGSGEEDRETLDKTEQLFHLAYLSSP